MNALYYGGGICTVEGDNIVAVMIRYSGAITIDDKTPEGYYIFASRKFISISPVTFKETGIPLNELFEYNGEFKIISTVIKNRNTTNKIPTIIKRVMDYSELLDSNAEDLTVKSENLSVGHKNVKRVTKTTLKQKTINNLHMGNKVKLFDYNGNEYNGYFHRNIENMQMMSGREPNKGSIKLKVATDPKAVKALKGAVRRQRRIKWRTKT